MSSNDKKGKKDKKDKRGLFSKLLGLGKKKDEEPVIEIPATEDENKGSFRARFLQKKKPDAAKNAKQKKQANNNNKGRSKQRKKPKFKKVKKPPKPRKVGQQQRAKNKFYPGNVDYRYTSPKEEWVQNLGQNIPVNDFGDGARIIQDATDK